MTDLHWLPLAEAGRAIATRKLSPVELTDALIERTERLNPQLHAVIHLDGDSARDAARAAETEIMAGHWRGSLHGIPVGLKDIIDVAGLPTTCHSRILLDNIAATDAFSVARLKAAGAVVLGKLATHEFATGGPSDDLPFPSARNPWNTAHHPGGSSSGSGAAVAAGLVPMALGTDTGGSIRHPAGACGIVGMKPTYGTVSRQGVFPLTATLDHVGPLTRTVEDNALVLDAIAGHDPQDPGSARQSAGNYTADLEKGVRGLKVGFVRHFHESDLVAHPEVAAGLENVARTLAAEGAEVRDVRLPPLQQFNSAAFIILNSHSWAIHKRWLTERPGDYGGAARRRLMVGAFLRAEDLARANAVRLEMVKAVEAALAEHDVLFCGAIMDPPCRLDDSAEFERTQARQARAPFNLTGHPALAMMTGLSSGGLPVAAQFVGRYFDEATVYRAARGWERASGVDRILPSI